MNPSITTSHLATGALLMAAAGSLSASGCEEAYCIDWFTIDSGGGEWTLPAGTIGQDDASDSQSLPGYAQPCLQNGTMQGR